MHSLALQNPGMCYQVEFNARKCDRGACGACQNKSHLVNKVSRGGTALTASLTRVYEPDKWGQQQGQVVFQSGAQRLQA